MTHDERRARRAEPAVILWRRLDRPGHEAARLDFVGGVWRLAGSAVVLHDGAPCSLDYEVVCDALWRSRSARVVGWMGERAVDVSIAVFSDNLWQLDGVECPAVAGCIDVDLNFSPSTNLLPIRRLALEVGRTAEVKAAWLRFPSFALEPLEQTYTRTEGSAYRYECNGGGFVAEFETTEAGFVAHYPGLARQVAGDETM